MRKLTEIVSEINDTIKNCLSYSDNAYFNISEQHEKDDKSFLLTRSDGTQGQIVVNTNQENVSFYHRILEEEISDIPGGRGNKVAQMQETTMRLVCYGQRKRIAKDQFNIDNQEFMTEVLQILNKTTTLTGKEFIIVQDQNSIFNEVNDEEFNGQLKKNLRLELVTFYIDYLIKRKINCDMELPIGTHLNGDFTSAPSKWILANGVTLNRNQYASYFGLITRRATTSLTNGSNIASVASASALAVGMKIEGTTLLPAGTEITNISGNILTLSNTATGDATDISLNYINALCDFGDGATTFKAPNLDGTVGVTDGTRVQGGSGGNTATNSIPAYTDANNETGVNQPSPNVNLSTGQTGTGFGAQNSLIYNSESPNTTISGDSAEGNMQPYYVVKTIIKVL